MFSDVDGTTLEVGDLVVFIHREHLEKGVVTTVNENSIDIEIDGRFVTVFESSKVLFLV